MIEGRKHRHDGYVFMYVPRHSVVKKVLIVAALLMEDQPTRTYTQPHSQVLLDQCHRRQDQGRQPRARLQQVQGRALPRRALGQSAWFVVAPRRVRVQGLPQQALRGWGRDVGRVPGRCAPRCSAATRRSIGDRKQRVGRLLGWRY